MPTSQPAPRIDQSGRFIDTGTGLIVPETYQRARLAHLASLFGNGIKPEGFNQGVSLERDHDTYAVRFPAKGSGADDKISEAIVDGRVQNIGVSPVVAPQISAMVRRMQAQAVTATVDITGRKTPFGKARDAISRFNDSPLGVMDALETLTYRLCTYNRGAPIATVPITYAWEEWEANGLIVNPILTENQKEEDASRYWLAVDWSTFGTPVPYLPHPLDLEPTGNTEYPYWYRVRRQGKGDAWVLLHHSQIIEILPGKSAQAGIGTSAVWMCLGYLAEQFLIIEERAEKLLYTLTDGILLLGGVEGLTGDKIEEQIKANRAETLERGMNVAKGSTIITSPLNQVSVAQVTFRQPPGVEFKEWREYSEDVIAFCFGEPLSSMVVRGGVGFGAQADMAAENTAESGVNALLHKIGAALGAIYPRVQITVSRSNDRARRLNIETLSTFSNAAAGLIDRGVLTPEQALLIIDRDILAIPNDDTLTSSANPEDDETDTDQQANDTTADTQTEQMALRWALDVLHADPEVTITDEDVDAAIEDAGDIDAMLADLLNADTVEE